MCILPVFLFVCLLFYFIFLFVCLFIAFAQVFHQNSLEKNEGEIHGLCCEMWSSIMKILIDIRVAVGCTNLFLADRYQASAIFLDSIQQMLKLIESILFVKL